MYHRSRKLRLGLIVVCVYAVAVATRLAPLHWSPLPATLDGYAYAAIAAETLTQGQIPLSGQRADHLNSPVVLGMASAITDIDPIYLAQALYGLVGAATALVAAVFGRRLARSLSLSHTRSEQVAILAGVAVAIEGLFVRRTGVPDNEAFTLLLVPLAALALFRYLRGRRRGWLVALLPLLVVLPLTHTFSALLGALTLTALAGAEILRRPTRRAGLPALALAGGFWAFMLGYYRLAAAGPLTVPYVGRLSAYPGLFLAWTVVLVVGVVWYQRTGGWLQRVLFLGPLGVFFGVVLLNRAVSVFPGTARTPSLVLFLLVPLVITVTIAGWAAPRLGDPDSVAVVLLVLLAAPVSHVLFGLTASLTPEFFATVLRAQTFGHVPMLVVASVGAVGMFGGRRVGQHREDGGKAETTAAGRKRWRRHALVGVLVLALVGTVPLAYVNLDTGSYPTGSTVTEFAAAGFISTHGGEATTDQKQGRIIEARGGSATTEAAAAWLDGGPPPETALVSKGYWTTTGAHLFPGAPRTVSSDRFSCTLTERHRVYHTDGIHAVSVTLPAAGISRC